MAKRSFSCLHLFWNCVRNQSIFKHPFDIWDDSEDLGVSSHRQSEAPLSPNDVNWWKRVQSAVASRLNCSFNETACKAALLLQDLMRELPACCSQLTSSCVTVMIIRNHLGAYWLGVVPNQTNRSTSVLAMFVVILVPAMKHEERRACGEVGKTSIALASTTYVHICLHAPVHLCTADFFCFSLNISPSYTHTQAHIYIQATFVYNIDKLAATLYSTEHTPQY